MTNRAIDIRAQHSNQLRPTLHKLVTFFVRPGAAARDVFMGLGGLSLVLAIISFAAHTFSFEPKPWLRPLGVTLAIAGGLCWLRGSWPTTDADQPDA